VALYGLYAGGAVTLAGLPVSICYGLAASVIPRLHGEGSGKKTAKALFVTVALSLPCAVILYVFSKQLGGLFFRNLSEERLEILSRLVRILSPTALTHACAQTLAACLIGKGQAKKAARNMAVAVAVKIALVLLLVGRQNISIYGMAIAANGCYLTAFVLNLCSNFI
jgi:O-antigen/teichoic acid export membrane protein